MVGCLEVLYDSCPAPAGVGAVVILIEQATDPVVEDGKEQDRCYIWRWSNSPVDRLGQPVDVQAVKCPLICSDYISLILLHRVMVLADMP